MVNEATLVISRIFLFMDRVFPVNIVIRLMCLVDVKVYIGLKL